MGTISFFNAKIHTLGTRVPPAERAATLHRLLTEYHAPGCSDAQKKVLKGEVIREVFYLLAKSAKGKCSSVVPIDDIISHMVRTTLIAMDKFDPTRGTKFTAFLQAYLKNAASAAYRDSFIIKHPMKLRRAALAKMRKMLEEPDSNDELTLEEQCQIEEQVRKAAPDVILTGDIYQAVDQETSWVGDNSMVDKDIVIPASGSRANLHGTIGAEDHMLVGEQVHLMAHLLSTEHQLLSPREKMVIKHRFGVFGCEQLTLEDIACKFHLFGWRATKNWIFQLEKRALEKIKDSFKQHDFTS